MMRLKSINVQKEFNWLFSTLFNFQRALEILPSNRDCLHYIPQPCHPHLCLVAMPWVAVEPQILVRNKRSFHCGVLHQMEGIPSTGQHLEVWHKYVIREQPIGRTINELTPRNSPFSSPPTSINIFWWGLLLRLVFKISLKKWYVAKGKDLGESWASGYQNEGDEQAANPKL